MNLIKRAIILRWPPKICYLLLINPAPQVHRANHLVHHDGALCILDEPFFSTVSV